MTDFIIEIKNLTKKYGAHTAVDSLNLDIRKGEIFGLLGPNGAGKSTTILMMLGLTDPSSGSVKVCGFNSTKKPLEVKKRVGYLPEDVGFYDDRTGLENLMYTAMLNGIPKKEAQEKALELMKKVGLTDAVHKKAGKYSRGMRQRLGLSDVLIKNPEIIILDEPTLGIDPEGVKQLLDLIVSLSRDEGLTVLLSSHHLHQVQQICDRVGLFVQGNLIAQGDLQELSQKLFSNEPIVIEADVSSKSGKNSVDKALENELNKIEGVKKVQYKSGTIRIGCSKNVAPEIAKVIVNTGSGLNYLSKMEYGLDEIYQNYFQREKNL